MKLQLLSVELNKALEEQSAQALLGVPRAIRDIEKMRRDAVSLKSKLDRFVENLSREEANHHESLRLLSELDFVKMKIETDLVEILRWITYGIWKTIFGKQADAVLRKGDASEDECKISKSS